MATTARWGTPVTMWRDTMWWENQARRDRIKAQVSREHTLDGEICSSSLYHSALEANLIRTRAKMEDGLWKWKNLKNYFTCKHMSLYSPKIKKCIMPRPIIFIGWRSVSRITFYEMGSSRRSYRPCNAYVQGSFSNWPIHTYGLFIRSKKIVFGAFLVGRTDCALELCRAYLTAP